MEKQQLMRYRGERDGEGGGEGLVEIALCGKVFFKVEVYLFLKVLFG